MFIKVDVAKVSDETAEENKLIGKEHYDDEDVVIDKVRININHITNYEQEYFGEYDQTCIELVTGTLIWVQESAESIDKKIKDVMFSNLIN